MKLPFDLGVKLLFRLTLPGFVFALGLAPLLFFGLDWVKWEESHVYMLVIVIIVSGWLLLVLDMPIYMAFEGRRYWPNGLLEYLVKLEKKRLEGLRRRTQISRLESIEAREAELKIETDQTVRNQIQEKIDSDEADFMEAYFDIRNFAMNSEGDYHAIYPTRLGNLISAYEDYSTRAYGMDTMFYWPRIWLKLDKDLREEIDNRQALVDSTVYVSFACFVNGFLWAIYGGLGAMNALIISCYGSAIFTLSHTLFEHLPRWWLSWLFATLFVLTGFLLYRISLPLHAQFGEIFKSVFDIFHDQINVTGVVGDVAEYANDYSILAKPRKRRMEVAFGYLQFGLINCRFCDKRISYGKMEEHLKTH